MCHLAQKVMHEAHVARGQAIENDYKAKELAETLKPACSKELKDEVDRHREIAMRFQQDAELQHYRALEVEGTS